MALAAIKEIIESQETATADHLQETVRILAILPDNRDDALMVIAAVLMAVHQFYPPTYGGFQGG